MNKILKIRHLLYVFLFINVIACGNSQENNGEPYRPSAPIAEDAVRANPSTSPSPPTDLTDEEEEEESEELGAPTKTENAIVKIRAEYARIQKQMEEGTLREEIKSFECKNDPGGGELTRYYDGKNLVAMRLEEGLEHVWEAKTIYLINNEPFFVFEEEGSWRFGGPLNEEAPNTIDQIKETRYYLKGGEIIRKLVKEYEIKSWEEESNNAEVPNKTIAVPTGTQYPHMAALPQWRVGNVGC